MRDVNQNKIIIFDPRQENQKKLQL